MNIDYDNAIRDAVAALRLGRRIGRHIPTSAIAESLTRAVSGDLDDLAPVGVLGARTYTFTERRLG